MKTTEKRLVLCSAEDWNRGINHKLKTNGNSIPLNIGDGITGSILLGPIDSGRKEFPWDRVIIDAELPEGSSLESMVFASDDENEDRIERVGALLKEPDCEYFRLFSQWKELFRSGPKEGTDFLCEVRGRYLWILLTLIQSGEKRPVIKSITLRMSGDHMTDYLPSIYRGNEVTEKFLSIFNSIFTDMDRQIDALPGDLDIETCSPEMLRYLAGWLGLEEAGYSTDRLRAAVRNIQEEYEYMYTPAGIRKAAERITGQKPLLLEYAFVDANAPDCPDPGLFRSFFGEDPYRFFLFLNKKAFRNNGEYRSFLHQMEKNIPAGMTMVVVTTAVAGSPGKEIDGTDKNKVAEFIRKVRNESASVAVDMKIEGENNE